MRPIIELPSLFIKYDFILSPDIRVKIEWLKKNTLAFECERKVKELLNE